MAFIRSLPESAKLPLLFVLLSLSPAFAQRVSLGVIGGTNLTNDVRSGRQDFAGGILPSGETSSSSLTVDPSPRRPILGLQFDYRISSAWSLEFDALHRELKSTETTRISPPMVLPNGAVLNQFGPFTRTLTPWEFPLLARYRFTRRNLSPFLTAGPSFRPGGTGTGLSHTGLSAGVGLEFRLPGGLRLSPTVRYTRWRAQPVGFIVGSPLRNQVELLVAIDRPSPVGFGVFGRRLSVGAIAGFGLGQDFTAGVPGVVQSESNNGIFGALLEVSLASGFALEVDGLYRPLHGSDLEFNQRVRFAHLTWEFPVLLKYRFPAHSRLVPFLEAGPSFRAEGNLNLPPVSHVGGTAGAGAETTWRKLKIAPTLRYSRWSGQSYPPAVSHASSNEVQLLFSVSF